MWFPWSPSKVPNNSSQANIEPSFLEELELQPAEEDVVHFRGAWGELSQLSSGGYTILGLSAFTVFSAGWAAHRRWDPVYSRYFKRIRRHYEVPDSFIKEKRYMKGIVTS